MGHNGAAHVYREALRAGLLDELAKSRAAAAELAQRCRLADRPTELLLEALSSLGLVVCGDDRAYALSTLGNMLIGGSYRNLGDEYWSHLPAYLATGEPLVEMDDIDKSEAYYQSQAAMLGWMQSSAAEFAARRLREVLPVSAAILDIGAGSAVWSLAVAQEAGDARVTAVDWPAVLEVARESADERGIGDRLTTLAGNYHEVEFPEAAFHLVILANITHLETPAGNRALLAKARRALLPHGRLAIVDIFPGCPQGDLNRTLYVLGLALRTKQGRVYSVAELSEMLCDCGFAVPKLLPLKVPPFVLGMLLA
jgi:ubiquinone/menaquinone biosynthesis C-methylase UbiE